MKTSKRLKLLKKDLKECYKYVNVTIPSICSSLLSMESRLKIRDMNRETHIRINELKKMIRDLQNTCEIENFYVSLPHN
jgi:hypothetical protein